MIVDVGSVAHGGGYNGTWYYRKWASGIAECFGRFTFTASHYTTALGGYGYYADLVYPSGLFVDIPTISSAGTVGNSLCAWGTILDGANHTKDGGRYYMVATVSGNQSCSVHVHAFGLWKTFEG